MSQHVQIIWALLSDRFDTQTLGFQTPIKDSLFKIFRPSGEQLAPGEKSRFLCIWSCTMVNLL